ncbi:MAG TPA: helix-turn-helix transcriptional regulator [Syntrophomonadaceae bacterium]|nr:helix-turn-helix transcriptional regulator [Syntrophomonadaceae bacterium]HRX21125.1 helix-turn-helix transcriptional regulator [Syntrophomonadaceae bacterium]
MGNNNSLTPEEVAEILKIKKHTVYELVKRGDLPAFRIGRKLRINPEDVDHYRQQDMTPVYNPLKSPTNTMELMPEAEQRNDKNDLIICGQDTILDILARQIENSSNPVRVLRKHVGSFAGLLALYQGQADIASAHLLDADSGQYNLPYARRLLPGIPVVIIHLAFRQQGFYVAAGNPLHITDWADLALQPVRFINREPGCGARVLLDEKLRQLRIDRHSINGYDEIATSHLAVASAVARGAADVGLGIQKAALQVRGLDFIPMQKEPYELLICHDDIARPIMQQVIEVINSSAFKNEVAGLGDYDLSMTGKITQLI